MKDKLMGSIFAGVGLFFLIEALRMPTENIYGFYGAPGVVPVVFSSLVILLSLIMVFRKRPQSMSSTKIEKSIARIELTRLLLWVGIFLLYVYLLGKINFIVLTSVFLSVTPMLFYRNKIWILPILGVITTYGIFYIFAKVFYLPIP